MRLRTPAILCLLWIVSSTLASGQEWRQGRGRLEGIVVNEKGDPLAEATVTLRYAATGQGPSLKTDKKGQWALLGMTGGQWSIEVSAKGYETEKQSLNVSEVMRGGKITTHLNPVVVQEKVAQTEVLVGGKKISKEAAAEIEKGNAALKEKKYMVAAEAFIKALPELPDNSSLLTNIALAYYFESKFDDALKYAHMTAAVEPDSVAANLMIAELELQKGNLDEGKSALSKVPADKISDPQPYLNVGILCYNKSRSAEAEEYFTKAISMKPDQAEAYYYRGLARLQLKKMTESQEDFEKYLELDPNGKEAETSRELLKSFKVKPKPKPKPKSGQ